MSTEDSRKAIYKKARAATGINKRQWARLFHLGEFKGAAEVDKKEREPGAMNSRGVSHSDALAAGLLRYLHQEGRDVANIEFDEDGMVKLVPLSGENKET